VSLWPGLLIGDLLANDYSTIPIGSAIGQTCGNVLEVVIAALLVRRVSRRCPPLDCTAGAVGVVSAMALCAAVSATVGNISLRLGGVLDGGVAWGIWRKWWLGDLNGMVLVVPLVLAWKWPRRSAVAYHRGVVEGAALMLAVVATSELAFLDRIPMYYVVFPAFIWAALRFGQRGSTVAVILSVGIGIWNTTHDISRFHFESITQSIVSLQFFTVIAAVSTMLLAAAVSERDAIARRLGAAQAEASAAAQIERMRLERTLHDGVQNRLLALGIRIARATRRESMPDDERRRFLEDVETQLEAVNDDLRTLALGLHPLEVESLRTRAGAGADAPVAPD